MRDKSYRTPEETDVTYHIYSSTVDLSAEAGGRDHTSASAGTLEENDLGAWPAKLTPIHPGIFVGFLSRGPFSMSSGSNPRRSAFAYPSMVGSTNANVEIERKKESGSCCCPLLVYNRVCTNDTIR